MFPGNIWLRQPSLKEDTLTKQLFSSPHGQIRAVFLTQLQILQVFLCTGEPNTFMWLHNVRGFLNSPYSFLFCLCISFLNVFKIQPLSTRSVPTQLKSKQRSILGHRGNAGSGNEHFKKLLLSSSPAPIIWRMRYSCPSINLLRVATVLLLQGKPRFHIKPQHKSSFHQAQPCCFQRSQGQHECPCTKPSEKRRLSVIVISRAKSLILQVSQTEREGKLQETYAIQDRNADRALPGFSVPPARPKFTEELWKGLLSRLEAGYQKLKDSGRKRYRF